MKQLFLASCCVGLLALAPVLARAQARTPPAGATTTGTAAPRGGESSGGGSTSGGSASSTAGSSSTSSGSGGSGGGGYSSGGNAIGRSGSYAGSRSTGTGASGYNAPSAIDRHNGPRSGETVASTRSGSYSRADSRGVGTLGQPVPAQTRPRGDGQTLGYAVPRGSVNPKPPDNGGGGGYVEPPYYAGAGWWYPYYGWSWGNWYWGNPCMWDLSYCGGGPYSYYQWFSPWSMWDDWSQLGYAYGGGAYAHADLGGIRFKVQPKTAEIWADGYFEGQVDDYDSGKGLQLKGGMHHIEVKAKGFETLTIDLRAMPGKTVTYTGALKPLQQ